MKTISERIEEIQVIQGEMRDALASKINEVQTIEDLINLRKDLTLVESCMGQTIYGEDILGFDEYVSDGGVERHKVVSISTLLEYKIENLKYEVDSIKEELTKAVFNDIGGITYDW